MSAQPRRAGAEVIPLFGDANTASPFDQLTVRAHPRSAPSRACCKRRPADRLAGRRRFAGHERTVCPARRRRLAADPRAGPAGRSGRCPTSWPPATPVFARRSAIPAPRWSDYVFKLRRRGIDHHDPWPNLTAASFRRHATARVHLAEQHSTSLSASAQRGAPHAPGADMNSIDPTLGPPAAADASRKRNLQHFPNMPLEGFEAPRQRHRQRGRRRSFSAAACCSGGASWHQVPAGSPARR